MPIDSSTPSDFQAAFTRTVDYFGPAALGKFQAATVAIVGLGGVGSHAACSLVRNGIGGVRLIDFDTLTWSSLNRHAVAVPEDVGRPKVDVMAQALRRINPNLRVETRAAFFGAESQEALLDGELSFVVDAIDSVNPKVDLISACVTRHIPIISCLGAAGRIHGEKVEVADLFESHTCPLARLIRKRVHRRGVQSGVPAVFSPEVPCEPLPPDDEPHLARGRRRNRLPSVGVVPGIVGYAAAGYILRTLAGSPE